MRDFKRIGGEILSSPLNENFRRLRNDISIANSNLIFSDKYGIMATIQDMENLKDNPEVELDEGQVCYVVSSGELYRFSELDDKWHKIADFGQTFRQSFLNSGVVLVESPIEVSTDYLLMPRMLVYFKNKPGEDPYLKGMYLIEAKEQRVYPPFISNMIYSIYVDYAKNYHVSPGLPKEDDPNNIFIGAFIPYQGELNNSLVYTMPNMAYTADRGQFLTSNGSCSGGELYVGEESHVISRKSGIYYDEGVNYPGESYYTYDFAQLNESSYTVSIEGSSIGYFTTDKSFTAPGTLVFYPSHANKIYVKQNDLTVKEYDISTGSMGDTLEFTYQNSIDNYPKSLDDTANYNIKFFDSVGTVSSYYYSTPVHTITNLQLTHEVSNEQVPITNIIYDTYVLKNTDTLATVPVGSFTIQKHLITPTGQNIMIYGDELYESFEDAESHLNDPVELDGDFLYAEVTRVVVQNPDIAFDPSEHCRFYTTNRLTQVGTISPVFADNEFKIYSHDDVTPTFLNINLDKIRDEIVTPTQEDADTYVKEYSLQPDTYNFTHYYFGLNNKYINGSYDDSHGAITSPVTATEAGLHKINANTKGYVIGSLDDIIDLRTRANTIENEIWDTYRSSAAARYNQSIRYRLYKLENDLYGDYPDSTSISIGPRLTTAESKIDNLEQLKANKNTTINGKYLGDPSGTYEATTIVLYTDDINEPAVSPNHRWFSQDLVKQNDWVIESHNHVARKGNGVESNANPHATTTDDITVLQNSDNLFLSVSERNKLVNVPNNTNQILTNLENNKMDTLNIYSIDADTQAETPLGGIKTLKVSTAGATITVDDDTHVGILECSASPQTVMYRSTYTPIADSLGQTGFVDKALYANDIDTTGAVASQYYGTDAQYPTTLVGWKSLPVYVSTGDAISAANIDSVILRPEDKSVALKHLANSRVVYTPADEETELGDNVYNLVKNHYHQVYNSGTQGPYIEDPNHPGTYIQDTSSIVYTYKVPYGGMAEHAYYFEYNNVNYTFNTTNLGTIPVNTILTYTPTDGNIEVVVSGTPRTLTTSQVQPTVVDDDYFIDFIAQTDWSKINKWNFGNNLSVTVSDGIATVNAFNATSDTPVHAFVNLDDVNFLYSGARPGQMIVINENCDGVELSNAPSLSSYMLISDYVNTQQPTKVNAAVTADSSTSATNALSANLLQNTYSVNDSATSSSTLWSANKITSIISNKIAAEGVNTYYDTVVPTQHTFTTSPKAGDLYILIE